MCFSWCAGVCDLTHLWHLQKAAEIPQHTEQLRSDQCVHTTPRPGWNICDWQTGSRVGGCPLISVCLFGSTHSVLTPVTWVPKWMWRMWEQRLHRLHLCSSLLLWKMKNALVQVNITHFFWTNQLRVFLFYSHLIKFYITKSFSLASRKESCLSGSPVVQ